MIYKQKRIVHRIWNEEDDSLILTMLLNGRTYNDICAAFTPYAARGSIQHRVGKMAKKGKCNTPKILI